MTKDRPIRFATRAGGLLIAAFAVGALPWPGEARAFAQNKPFILYFSDKAGDPEPRSSIPLRPNVLQQFFVYVRNTTDNDTKVTVELRVGKIPVEGSAVTFPVKGKGAFTQVRFGPQVPPVPPPAPPPAP